MRRACLVVDDGECSRDEREESGDLHGELFELCICFVTFGGVLEAIAGRSSLEVVHCGEVCQAEMWPQNGTKRIFGL
jgi:hypothetical protein